MLRIAFAGTPEFAARALAALADTEHRIAAVLTQPDRPAGRGQAPRASAVKQLAQRLGLEVRQPASLREPALQQALAGLALDLMVVAAYGLIVPAPMLAIPRLGCVNIHASLLPRWRGAAPIQRAIEAGDSETGITIMQMDAGLDTGPMLLRVPTPIRPDDTGGSLHDRLAALGARAIVEAVAALESGTARAVPQPDEGATYAARIARSDVQLDFTLSAPALADRVRAFDPVPGAGALLDRDDPVPIKIWRAVGAECRQPGHAHQTGAGQASVSPGTVVRADSRGLVVATGDGALTALELQRPGGRRLPAEAFLRGFPVRPGERFRAPGATH